MRLTRLTSLATICLILGISTGHTISAAPQTGSDTVPVRTVVSVEAKHGKEIPEITNKEDIRAFEGQERLRVAEWLPFQGAQANLELLVLIDESIEASVANQFDEIRRFMNAQPPTTAIAVGYLEYGTVKMAQNFTADREATGKALRIPLGAFAAGNSPYLAMTDAIKRWPASKAHHAIFLISDGIDALQPGITDSYLDQAVETAERTGTQVYSIFASREGHFGHSLWRINQGQNNLSELADKTGGESYFQGQATPVSFAPFLNEFAERLGHQYLLTVLVKADKKSSFKHLKLETEIPNAELVTADRIYVPAAK